jgi:hypothetical protein
MVRIIIISLHYSLYKCSPFVILLHASQDLGDVDEQSQPGFELRLGVPDNLEVQRAQSTAG